MQEQLQPGKVILVEAGLQTVHAWSLQQPSGVFFCFFLGLKNKSVELSDCTRVEKGTCGNTSHSIVAGIDHPNSAHMRWSVA